MTFDIGDIDFELRRAVSNLIDALVDDYGLSDEKCLDIIERHFMRAVESVNDELCEVFLDDI